MNIFYLDHRPQVAAEKHVYKHVIKMIVESAQMLCTAHRVLDGFEMTLLDRAGRNRKTYGHNNQSLYKATHINHPSNKWVRESHNNYMWLAELALHLSKRYTKITTKKHATHDLILWLINNYPKNIPISKFVPPPQAMPDKYKDSNSTVAAYRRYYFHEKLHMQPELRKDEIYADL